MKNKYEIFAKKIINKFRDENYSNYLKSCDLARKLTLKEYYDLPRNENYDKNLQQTDDDRFEFINSLNAKQKKQLDILILKTLDEAAFNFLREVEESYHFSDSIGITFKGKTLDDIYNDFLSGTFFGEYFLWVEKFSKYGEYQH